MEQEILKQLKDFPDYYVSNHGNIYSNKNSKEGLKKLKPWNHKGYFYIQCVDREKKKRYLVHRLVAKYFVEGYFDGAVVNHINANGLDNYYKNLEWVTQRENVIKSYETSNLSQVRNFKHYILKFPNGDLSKEFKTFKKVIEYIVSNNLDVSYNSLNIYGKSRGFELIKY